MSESNGQLRAFVERIENVETEIKDRNDDKADIYREAKGSGFDVPTLKKVVALRRKGPAKLQEQEALLDLYLAEIGA